MRSCSGCSAGTAVFHRILPSFRFSARRWRLSAVISPGSREEVAKPVKQVRKMRFPRTIGLEAPGPGSAAFQTMFDVSLQFRTTPAESPRPRAPGPRNWGKSARTVFGASNHAMARRHGMFDVLIRSFGLVAKKPGREIMQAAAPGLPLVIGAGRRIEDVLDACAVQCLVHRECAGVNVFLRRASTQP